MESTTDLDTGYEAGPLYRLLKALRGSLLLSIAAAGAGLLLLGVVFDSPLSITAQDGIIAGMLGVFGISAILGGGVSYVLLKIVHRL